MNHILKRIIFVVVLVAIFALAVVIALKNTDPLTFNFLMFKVSTSAANVVIGSFVAGGIVGLLAGMGLVLRLQVGKRWAERKAKKFEDEIHKIRSSPIKE